MGSPKIFQEDAVLTMMRYFWTKERGEFKLVYRPVDYSAFQDSRWLVQRGICISRLLGKNLCTTLSGTVITPQGALVVWRSSTVQHVFVPTHLSIAIKLYVQNNLFEYVQYNINYTVGSYGLFASTQLLYRHYVEQ